MKLGKEKFISSFIFKLPNHCPDPTIKETVKIKQTHKTEMASMPFQIKELNPTYHPHLHLYPHKLKLKIEKERTWAQWQNFRLSLVLPLKSEISGKAIEVIAVATKTARRGAPKDHLHTCLLLSFFSLLSAIFPQLSHNVTTYQLPLRTWDHWKRACSVTNSRALPLCRLIWWVLIISFPFSLFSYFLQVFFLITK